MMSFIATGVFWAKDGTKSSYNKTFQLDLGLSESLIKIKGELFKACVEEDVFRARVCISCQEEDIDERFGFGAEVNISDSMIKQFKDEILNVKKVSCGLALILDQIPWLSNSDLAILLKTAFPGISSEASQIVWKWSRHEIGNIREYDHRLYQLIEDSMKE